MSADLEDVTANYANSVAPASVSTDDWPFFYMPQRIYPVSYLIMIGLILLLSLLLVGNFVGEDAGISQRDIAVEAVFRPQNIARELSTDGVNLVR